MGEDALLTVFCDGFGNGVGYLGERHGCGVESEKSGEQWGLRSHLILCHAVPDWENHAAPTINLLRKKGVEFGLRPLFRKEAR